MADTRNSTRPRAVPTSRVKAVFVDRDGVINENRNDHVKSWAEFRFIPGAADALAQLTGARLQVFVVTNQAAINRGLMSRADADAVNQRMMREIERCGGRIEGIACCPHRPDEQCACRKPQPGLLLKLAREHHLDASEVVMIGDALTDVQAGLAAGCQPILVLTGRGSQQLALAAAAGVTGFRVASDLGAAAQLLLEEGGDTTRPVRQP